MSGYLGLHKYLSPGSVCRLGQARVYNATYTTTTTCIEFMELIYGVLNEEATVKLKKYIDTFGSWALMADETYYILYLTLGYMLVI